jgi:hypothetical protein
MNLIDASPASNDQDAASSSDFTLLEGLYQLTVTGHTNEWEFERLNNAVYERLLSSYGDSENGPRITQTNAMLD